MHHEEVHVHFIFILLKLFICKIRVVTPLTLNCSLYVYCTEYLMAHVYFTTFQSYYRLIAFVLKVFVVFLQEKFMLINLTLENPYLGHII